MKTLINVLVGLLIASLFVFSGCSSGGGDSATGDTTSLSGVAQKGAFVEGSNVSLCKLDEEMLCTSDVLEAKVSDEKGSYEFKTLPWSGLSRLTISGYYLDELTGATSLSPATITAIVNIKSKIKHKTNTNLLTDMRAKRMKKLVEKGKSIDEASAESEEDVKKLFNVSSDDFTALDLVDFSAGNASVNVELLRISAAVANTEDPVATLEELMKIYNEYGIEGVLNSTLYRTLMGLVEDVDVKEVLTKMVSADEVDVASIADLAPFAIANIVTYGSVESDNKVRVTLLGTEFIDTPSITVSSSDNSLGIDAITLADDNRSVVLDMNISTSCQDINAIFTIDYLSLKDVENPIQTSTLHYRNSAEYCTSEIIDEEDLGSITLAPNATISLVPLRSNQIKLSLAGTEFENHAGTIYAELITSSETLVIDEAVVADNNKSVIFTLNEPTDYCAENNVTIHLNADSLKDVESTLESNKIRYVSPNVISDCGNENAEPINFLNRAPTVSITPSTMESVAVDTTLELTAVASDANDGDTVTLAWRYKKVDSDDEVEAGTTAQFSHVFDETGQYSISVTATDNHGAEVEANIIVSVIAVNHAPVVSISPAEDKLIYIGDSVILKSSASDEDGDELNISWKIKETNDADFTVVENYGAMGFNHTFNSVGTYLVVVEAQDGNGSKADANITVNVAEVPPIAVTLDDIDIELDVKGTYSFDTGIAHTVDVAIDIAPEHGTAEAYLVGGESWYLRFTGTDCFIGSDSFIYKSGDDYGRVNVTIKAPSSLEAPNISKTLFNTETIIGEYLTSNKSATITTSTTGGSSSLVAVGGEFVHYNYDPDDTFVGNDFFEYTVNDTINECQYSATGRVDFNVSELVLETRVISACRDPHYIGTEMYKTDGTLTGTTLVKDLAPGIYSTKDAASTGFVDFEMYEKVGDMQYFSGYYSSAGARAIELWQTDATEEGTQVFDINDNGFTSEYLWGSSHSAGLHKVGEYMFFTATDSTSDRYGTYRADKDTLERIADFSLGKIVEMNGTYYSFISESTDSNVSIYRLNSDLNATELVETFVKPQDGKPLSFLGTIGSKFIFSQYRELYSISLGEESSSLIAGYGYDYESIVKYNDKMYFIMSDDAYQGQTIVETDGTSNGTSIVYTFGDDMISAMVELNGKLYFKGAIDDAYDRDYNLYEYDISTANVTLIKDIQDGSSTRLGLHMGMDGMQVVDGKIIYESVNMEIVNGEEQYFEQVWASDGTSEGTVAILRRDRKDYGDRASDLKDMFELNGAYYFQDTSSNLYKTDFSEYGTTLILDYICDISPDSTYFADVNDAELSTVYEANITIEGINYPQTQLSVVNGEYSLDDGVTWSTQETTIQNGQKVKVRHTSHSNYNSIFTTRLYVGDDYFDFTTRTVTETLTTPNQFTFTDVTNANVDTIQTANITVSGINVEVALSIIGGEYSLDGGTSWSTVDVNVSNNQAVYVRHTSSISNEMQVDTVLTVGGVSDTFSSTTRAASGGEDTVTVGSLMWEDTAHVVGETNYVTWSEAQGYCSELELDGYVDWRLPHSYMNTGDGSEIMDIRVVTEADGDNAIAADFTPVYEVDRVATWTDESIEDGWHIAMIFQYDVQNGDSFSDAQDEVNVRCVRDVE